MDKKIDSVGTAKGILNLNNEDVAKYLGLTVINSKCEISGTSIKDCELINLKK